MGAAYLMLPQHHEHTQVQCVWVIHIECL
jgi:hypothetical protein